MEKLKADLERLVDQLQNSASFRESLENLISVYPFNEYEYVISTLLGAEILTTDDYYELRDEYIARNMFMYIFEISAPRGFGEGWAQGHLKELIPSLQKPSKRLDPEYSGQYDFFLDTDDKQINPGLSPK